MEQGIHGRAYNRTRLNRESQRTKYMLGCILQLWGPNSHMKMDGNMIRLLNPQEPGPIHMEHKQENIKIVIIFLETFQTYAKDFAKYAQQQSRSSKKGCQLREKRLKNERRYSQQWERLQGARSQVIGITDPFPQQQKRRTLYHRPLLVTVVTDVLSQSRFYWTTRRWNFRAILFASNR